ncbi:dihydrofolate reductase family protein [uncultured Jatrophihabitans sp.]|uniref:dihydrofolate reductase family protein n=1 Tax=uncultured Jatrophihabitans sp. TaxID=1610747 RepID=UPI0035CB14DD
MRALFPAITDVVDVHAVYARGWLEHGGVRANFVTSSDGAAQADGRSAGLQTPGDNRVFAALRDLADVVLVGAGTAVAEGYAPTVLSDRRRAVRRDHGLDPALPTAVTSRTLRLDPASALFAGADGPRTIVLTCASAPAEQRERLAQHTDVVVCGDDDVDLVAARAALVERGLTRVLSEGGPTAFAQLVRAGVVDELCLSVSPMLIGPGPGRITAGADEWPDPSGLELVSVLTEDSALFLRYRVIGR